MSKEAARGGAWIEVNTQLKRATHPDKWRFETPFIDTEIGRLRLKLWAKAFSLTTNGDISREEFERILREAIVCVTSEMDDAEIDALIWDIYSHNHISTKGDMYRPPSWTFPVYGPLQLCVVFKGEDDESVSTAFFDFIRELQKVNSEGNIFVDWVQIPSERGQQELRAALRN